MNLIKIILLCLFGPWILAALAIADWKNSFKSNSGHTSGLCQGFMDTALFFSILLCVGELVIVGTAVGLYFHFHR